MTPKAQTVHLGLQTSSFNNDLFAATSKKLTELFEALARVGKELISHAEGAASTSNNTLNNWATGINTTLNNWATGANHKINSAASAADQLIKASLKKMGEMLVSLAEKLVEVMRGIVAPPAAFVLGYKWVEAHKYASDVVSELQPGVTLKVGVTWQGKGADSYNQKQQTQLAAMEKFRDMCTDIWSSTVDVAKSGSAFYIALLVPLVEIIATAVAAAGAATTGVLTAPAATGGAMMIAKRMAMIVAIVGAFANYLNTMAYLVGMISLLAEDNSRFPQHAWPHADSKLFRYDPKFPRRLEPKKYL